MNKHPHSPKEAKSVGSEFYFTGRPCVNGNVDVRRTSNANCLCATCRSQQVAKAIARKRKFPEKAAEIRKRSHAKHKVKRNADSRNWMANNRQRKFEYARKYYAENTDRALAAGRNWRKNNRDRHNKLVKDWYANNPGWKAAKDAKRRVAKIKGSPLWLTSDMHAQIMSLYAEARRLTEVSGESYHVDHIIPLRHPRVCGLHVPWNLRVISASENCAKGNRFQENGLDSIYRLHFNR